MTAQNPKVTVSPATKARLDAAKIHPRETYDDVINRALDARNRF